MNLKWDMYGSCQRSLTKYLNIHRTAAKNVFGLLINASQEYRVNTCTEYKNLASEDIRILPSDYRR